MLTHAETQVCAVSGKTDIECAKLLISQSVTCSQGSEFEGLEDTHLKANPIRAGFGESETEMNKNPFGRATGVLFIKEGAIDGRGATLTEHLLEKARVVAQGEGEQNDHVLCTLFVVCAQHADLRLQVGNPADVDFPYLTANPGIFDPVGVLLAEFEITADEIDRCLRLEALAFTEVVFQTLASIIKIANVVFDQNDIDEATSTSGVANVAEIRGQLGVDQNSVEGALVVKIQTARGSSCEKRCTAAAAGSKSRAGAATKTCGQNRVRRAIVNVNRKLAAAGRDTTPLAVGVLGIFGLAVVGRNGSTAFSSTDQLDVCIDLANERLGVFFPERLCGPEIEAHQGEGVAGADVKCEDIPPCLDVTAGKGNLCGGPDERPATSDGAVKQIDGRPKVSFGGGADGHAGIDVASAQRRAPRDTREDVSLEHGPALEPPSSGHGSSVRGSAARTFRYINCKPRLGGLIKPRCLEMLAVLAVLLGMLGAAVGQCSGYTDNSDNSDVTYDCESSGLTVMPGRSSFRSGTTEM